MLSAQVGIGLAADGGDGAPEIQHYRFDHESGRSCNSDALVEIVEFAVILSMFDRHA